MLYREGGLIKVSGIVNFLWIRGPRSIQVYRTVYAPTTVASIHTEHQEAEHICIQYNETLIISLLFIGIEVKEKQSVSQTSRQAGRALPRQQQGQVSSVVLLFTIGFISLPYSISYTMSILQSDR